MKQVVTLVLVLFLCGFFRKHVSSEQSQIEAVISLENFSNPQIHTHLVKEFSKINGVSFCETSLDTETLIVKFDENEFSVNDIKHILEKWECKIRDISFSSLFNFVE